MAITVHAICTAAQFATTEIGSGTDRRDVSEMLDLWAHKWTPFLNMLSWGPESGATSLEWISEHLGYGYVVIGSAAGTGTLSTRLTAGGGVGSLESIKQLNSGCILMHYATTLSEVQMIYVDTIAASCTIQWELVVPAASGSMDMSLADEDKLYIIGSLAGEGSTPRVDRSRERATLSNAMAIIRKDIQMTGSLQATDMHAVPNELKHQMRLRLLEMQRDREMLILFSMAGTRSSTVAGAFNGIYGFLEDQTGDMIKTTSQSFTENSVNDVAAALYDNGASPNVLVAATSQIRKFTDWNRDRVRTKPDSKIGGHHVAYYLTDTGTEVRLIPMRKFPPNFGFLLDTELIVPRAKKGRKLLIEKLGKQGDYDQWQLISEFSVEIRKYNQGCHGMWSKLE